MWREFHRIFPANLAVRIRAGEKETWPIHAYSACEKKPSELCSVKLMNPSCVMNLKRALFLTCFLAITLSVPVALADGHRSGGGARSGSAARPGSGVRPGFVRSTPRVGVRNSGGNFQYRNGNWNANRRITNLNRSTANWRGGNGRVGTSFNHNGNWRHRHHNRFVFIGGFGFPCFYPYYPASYYYPYGYYGSDYYPYGSSYYGSYYGSEPGYYEGGDPGYGQQYDDQSQYDRNGRQNNSVVARVQERLAHDGYYKGAIDGVAGSRTYYAIRAYQRDHNLRADGAVSDHLLNEMGLK
jgi:putative peptidoglycan binding protein